MGLECIILSKSARGRKILYDSTDMWNLKNKTKQNKTCRYREQIDIARGRDEGGKNGWRGWNIMYSKVTRNNNSVVYLKVVK